MAESTGFIKLQQELKYESKKLRINGVVGSSMAVLASAIEGRNIYIHNDKEEAAYFFNDLTNILGKDNVLFYPASFNRTHFERKEETSNVVLRTEVLNKIAQNDENYHIITYPDAVFEKVLSKDEISSNTFSISVGDSLGINFVCEVLYEYKFEKTDFVYEPGQFAIRGSIIDIFSFSHDYPFRIDFFGDDVDSIRTFNIDTQLSNESKKKISIIPNIQRMDDESGSYISLFEYINRDSNIWIKDFDAVKSSYEKIVNKLDSDRIKSHLIDVEALKGALGRFKLIQSGLKPIFDGEQINFDFKPHPVVHRNFELLGEKLISFSEKECSNFILSENEKQIERIEAIFEDLNQKVKFTGVKQILHEGFVSEELGIAVLTDHQIFDRYHRFKLRTSFTKKESIKLSEINNLQPGDYVVHTDHGIGKFGGLQSLDVNGKKQEAIRLIYKNDDIIYVSIHSLHRISKYKGKDGTPPKIHKLGGTAWQTAKAKTKSKIKDIAEDLIKLYAKRRSSEGFSFSPDSFLQRELESSFIYEDTPDQLKSTIDVKRDMENKIPMDRLVCGDVGFGKTEIAIRAAFKAVADNKQVAVLVPTTVLCLQHYYTFKKRLKRMPCNIEYINRLRTAKDQKKVKEGITNGNINIVIGTHKLVGKDINFKDLGLLIIDEEQKFGVAVKEKLKALKTNVDTLTLTATPIPRTLQFSLMGARDLSIINTPPPNRHPIVTEVHTFNEDMIRESINYEVERNGQVFFIHNRVQNIMEVKAMVNRICPDVRVVVGHGQMKGPELEGIMLDFINGEYDVLIATTIIESGLDIPNANTIIINNAHYFGLSDLHQLRGRVGRSNKKAFCYLLSPPELTLTQEARRKLRTIENFSDLGSGFNIAMQDLDIRGAGNMLGGEQSGFISDIGFETYHKILDEAIQELKETKFSQLFSHEKQQSEGQTLLSNDEKEVVNFVSDCIIESDMSMLFPQDYIENISERIKLYRELDNLTTETDLQEFEKKLTDRFGKLPNESVELMNVVRLRWLAKQTGIEKILLKNGKMKCYFISDPKSVFYQSGQFNKVITYATTNHDRCSIKEKDNKLSIGISKIGNVTSAISNLKLMVG